MPNKSHRLLYHIFLFWLLGLCLGHWKDAGRKECASSFSSHWLKSPSSSAAFGAEAKTQYTQDLFFAAPYELGLSTSLSIHTSIYLFVYTYEYIYIYLSL